MSESQSSSGSENKMTTLEAFRATARDTEDLSEASMDESHVGVPGRVYLNVLTIERHGDEWWLHIGRDEWIAPLAELELRLYEWALSEGYCGEPTNQQEREYAMSRELDVWFLNRPTLAPLCAFEAQLAYASQLPPRDLDYLRTFCERWDNLQKRYGEGNQHAH